jgi:dipeptide transport system permease protein
MATSPNPSTPHHAEGPAVEGPLAKAAGPEAPWRETWNHFRANKGAMVGLCVVVVLVLVAIFADVLAPYSPIELYSQDQLRPPVWAEGGKWEFILGTDAIGRDMLSRLMHGARLSLMIGFFAAIVSLIAGVIPGMLDIAIMRLMDIMLALPSLLLAIVIVAILGPSLINAMIAVSIVYVPHFTRLTRSAVLTERAKDYVAASRVSGAGLLRLMFITVLPNCAAPLIVQATLSMSTAILDAAALGFLGLGAQAPTPEWGTMLANAREFIQRAWWIVTFPGIAILVTVLSFNLMGDGLRDALDPKLKNSG